ncbi:unnamed protein product [Paramecium sonneborni]|uniref:Uncharacterized protein n=1 Tax=Paramecium sonneborni TaxID=65129 RepID=A0A8S1QXR8_9CILI|nr:unnamed protein product [Paramecium sonneborni]
MEKRMMYNHQKNDVQDDLYNFSQLKCKLKNKVFQFSNHSDTNNLKNIAILINQKTYNMIYKLFDFSMELKQELHLLQMN